jgi:hypothetical protein
MKSILIPLLLPLCLPALLCSSNGLRPGPVDPPPASSGLPFETFAVRAGSLPADELTAVLRSAREYETLVGYPAPKGIDFSKTWVVLYSGGVVPTSVARAEITGVELTEGGHALKVKTLLMVSAKGIEADDGKSIPYALATIACPKDEILVFRTEHAYADLP